MDGFFKWIDDTFSPNKVETAEEKESVAAGVSAANGNADGSSLLSNGVTSSRSLGELEAEDDKWDDAASDATGYASADDARSSADFGATPVKEAVAEEQNTEGIATASPAQEQTVERAEESGNEASAVVSEEIERMKSLSTLPSKNLVEVHVPLTTAISSEANAEAESQVLEHMADDLDAQLDAEIDAATEGLLNQLQDEIGEDDGELEDDEDDEDDEDIDEEDEELLEALQNEVIASITQAVSSVQSEPAANSAPASAPETVEKKEPEPVQAPTPAEPQAPRGLGMSALPSLPKRRTTAVTAAPRPAPLPAPVVPDETPQEKERREKFMDLRVKLLRATFRFGQSMEHSAVAQVLYRLRLLEQALAGAGGRAPPESVNVEAATIAANLENSDADGAEANLDLDCTILVLGKIGSGKTTTIRSIFDDAPVSERVNPTTSLVERVGTVKGIKMKFIDTPGLYSSVEEQGKNVSILNSVKKCIKKHTPDVVLFFDRLDWISTALNDLPLFRTVTGELGPTLWYNSMLVLTHGAAAPPEDGRGNKINPETFIAQRSFIMQQCIRQASNEVRLQIPTAVVENHPNCAKNEAGEAILPNKTAWKPQLLLLCFASITLSNTNSLMKAQQEPSKDAVKKGLFKRFKELIGLRGGGQQVMRLGPGGLRMLKPRHNTLPFMLSQLLQPKEPLRPEDEQNAMEEELDDDLVEEDLLFEEEEIDLPPFRKLSQADYDRLSSKQKKEYNDEIKEREKIMRKEQFREQMRQRREAKLLAPYQKKISPRMRRLLRKREENEQRSKVVAYLPEIQLPPSFDADNPTFRYRALDMSPWVVRPLLGQQSWDHDPGFDTFSVERSAVIEHSDGIPASVAAQISKDKNDGSLMLEANASKWHGEVANTTPVTTAGLDIQTMGSNVSYTARADHRVTNFGRNKTNAGLCLNVIGGILSYGLKLEDRFSLGRRGKVSGGVGLVSGRGDRAVGIQTEATINHSRDYPLDRSSTTVGASVMEWQKDLSLGANAATSFAVKDTSVNGRINLNNRGAGQLTVRLSSTEHLALGLVGLVPLLQHFVGYRLLGRGQGQGQF